VAFIPSIQTPRTHCSALKTANNKAETDGIAQGRLGPGDGWL
jgi:hypothetical protein